MSNEVSSINHQLVANDKSITSLHDVDDLKVTAHTDIGDSRVTSVAHTVLNYDPEAMIWQDSPSPSLMLPSLLKWVSIIAIWCLALIVLRPAPAVSVPIDPTPSVQETVEAQSQKSKNGKTAHKTAEDNKANAKTKSAPAKRPTPDDTAYTWTLYIGLLVLAYQLYSHGVWYLRINNTSYKMSSQRIAIESGIFSKAVNAYELHQLQNGQVYKPWNLRLFGRENLYISGLWLSGIKNAEAVRDLIRNAGQIEASRIEKARYR